MKVLVAGDFCPMDRVSKLIEDRQYDSIFEQVVSVVKQSDYSIVNFECPVRKTIGEGIKKAGPTLKCSEKAIDAIRHAGFNCATLANNHFYDQGEDGVKETIHALDMAGLDHVGGGFNFKDAALTLYKTIKGKTLAIINCCEHEFSIATDTKGGSNPLNIVQQYYAIQEARQKAEYVLVIVHGGIEHFQFPSPRMVETYRFFIDAGADAVINHHQHCFSGFESYRGKPIFYGLGNFCFDWQKRRTKLWDEGFMVMLDFADNYIGYQLYPYFQNNETPGVHLMDDASFNDWKQRFDSISEVICDSKILLSKYNELLARTERNYSANLTPYTNRFALALYKRHFLPMLLSKRKLRTLLNMLMCESHYDRMINMLRNYSK